MQFLKCTFVFSVRQKSKCFCLKIGEEIRDLRKLFHWTEGIESDHPLRQHMICNQEACEKSYKQMKDSN